MNNSGSSFRRLPLFFLKINILTQGNDVAILIKRNDYDLITCWWGCFFEFKL